MSREEEEGTLHSTGPSFRGTGERPEKLCVKEDAEACWEPENSAVPCPGDQVLRSGQRRAGGRNALEESERQRHPD